MLIEFEKLQENLVPKPRGGEGEMYTRTFQDENNKIMQIRLEEAARSGRELFENYDAGELTSRTFGMFGGKEETICLEAHNRLVGVVLDRFGRDIMIQRKDHEHFKTLVRVNVSDQFFGWIASLGPDAVIASPDDVRGRYREFLEKSLSNYK